jgi:uncharacterized membrane protein
MVTKGDAAHANAGWFEDEEDQAGARGGPPLWAWAVAGGALALAGLSRRSLGGAALAAVGCGLLYRGLAGTLDLDAAVDRVTRLRRQRAGVGPGEGAKIVEAVTIRRDADALYRFWRDLANLPRVMSHVETVRALDAKRSHWVVRAPAGTTVEWDAEIVNDEVGELIGWRSLPGAVVGHAGSVRFERAPGGRGTRVVVVLRYEAPAGPVGRALAMLSGDEPGQQLREDLRRFKQLMETGEIATTAGQPAGR